MTWRIILTTIRRPARPKRDTPLTRFYSHVRAGSSDVGAAKLTADSYGIGVFETDEHGLTDFNKPVHWTVEQINGLLFARWRREHADLTDWPDGEPG